MEIEMRLEVPEALIEELKLRGIDVGLVKGIDAIKYIMENFYECLTEIDEVYDFRVWLDWNEDDLVAASDAE